MLMAPGWDLNPIASGDVTRNLSFFIIVLFLGEWHYLLPALAAKPTPRAPLYH
jgi:hypothetical protein